MTQEKENNTYRWQKRPHYISQWGVNENIEDKRTSNISYFAQIRVVQIKQEAHRPCRSPEKHFQST